MKGVSHNGKALLVGVGLYIVILGPIIPVIIQSFAFQWHWPDLLPRVWWWSVRADSTFPLAWDYVLSPYSHVFEAAGNTLFISLSVTLLALILCLPAARVLVSPHFKWKTQILSLFTLPLIVPEMALALAFLAVFIPLGLAGTYTGIIVAHLIPVLPYMMRVLVSVYQGLNPAVVEQAQLLGASRWQRLVHITIPLLLPGILAGCLFTLLVSSNIFLITFLVGQGRVETLPTLLFSKIGGGALDATAAGLTLIAMIPGFILLLATERHIRDYQRVGAVGRSFDGSHR